MGKDWYFGEMETGRGKILQNLKGGTEGEAGSIVKEQTEPKMEVSLRSVEK
jgi:hypothetical protein